MKLVLGILLFIFCLPAIFPLFHNGFFITDDGEWMIIRFSAFYQALADGQFPVRFLHRLNFDYGYPVATFLYPGFMYFGVLFHLLKIGFVETIKLILAISLIGTTFFAYLWLDKIFKNKLAAFVGSLVSLYIPYHLYDIYTRGSVGEVFALLWIPFIFWMIERDSALFISIGIALLIISHNTLAVLFLPIIIFYMLIKILNLKSKKRLIYQYTSILVIAFGMAAFFIIPAIFELPLTQFSKMTISDPTKYFTDISLVGISTLIIFIIAGGLLIFRKKTHNESGHLIRLFLLVTFFAVFLSSSYSAFLWQIIPSSFVQFPFRLLSYLIFSVAFLASFIIYQIQSTRKKIIFISILAVLFLASSYKYLSNIEFIDRGEGFYATNEATTTVQHEYLPTWVRLKSTQRPKNKVELTRGSGAVGDIAFKINSKNGVENIAYNNKEINFSTNISKDDYLRLWVNTIYWPGWKAYVDGKVTKIYYSDPSNPKGLITIIVPKGKHQVKLVFEETSLRLFSDAVSLISLGGLLFITLRREK